MSDSEMEIDTQHNESDNEEQNVVDGQQDDTFKKGVAKNGVSGVSPHDAIKRDIEKEVNEAKAERTMPLAEKKERKKRVLTEKQLKVLEMARAKKKEKAMMRKAETTIITKQKQKANDEERISKLVEEKLKEKLASKSKSKRKKKVIVESESESESESSDSEEEVVVKRKSRRAKQVSKVKAPTPASAPVKSAEQLKKEYYDRLAHEELFGR